MKMWCKTSFTKKKCQRSTICRLLPFCVAEAVGCLSVMPGFSCASVCEAVSPWEGGLGSCPGRIWSYFEDRILGLQVLNR